MIINNISNQFNRLSSPQAGKETIISEAKHSAHAFCGISASNYKAYFMNKPNTITFKGNISGSCVGYVKGNFAQNTRIQTSFFRDPATLEFVADYVNKNYKDKNQVNIADFGCSVGEETYTLAMMLNDPKYHITGYDVVPDALEVGKEATYVIYQNNPGSMDYIGGEDCFLLKEEKELYSDTEKSYHKMFHKHFSETDEPKELINNNSVFESKVVKDLRHKKYFKLNEESIKAKINFKDGNFNSLNEVLEPGKTDVIIFKNALYHIFPDVEKENDKLESYLKFSEDKFKKINQCLPVGGLFVLGSLKKDHFVDVKTMKKHQGERIDNTPIHDVLRKNGFEPVFYDKNVQKFFDGTQIFVELPSVWKKVRD